jgi:hypothetical protein
MARIAFRLTGRPPGLLMHNPAGMRRTQETIAKKRIPTPEEEAAASAYRAADQTLYVPSDAIRAALIEGGKGRRLGKYYLSKLLTASVFCVDEQTPLRHPRLGTALTEYEIDVRRVVVQRQGVLRARARIPAWQCVATLEYDADFLTPAHILEALNLGGRIAGLLDYRPSCPVGKGGPFGRFTAELVD